MEVSKPAEDQIEVSVFGPGYGECVVVHVGAGKWIVVDSCIGKGRAEPAALEYLETLGVDLAEHVMYVVATHWHDDHVRGLARVFEACQKANLVLPSALSRKEFITLATGLGSRSMMKSSGVQELEGVLRELQRRSAVPVWAHADRTIYHDGSHLRLVSLSPSDDAFTAVLKTFAELFPAEGQAKRRVVAPRPNHTAVVLHLTFGQQSVLLGSDLEERTAPFAGWSNILASRGRPCEPAAVYKIAHHGSANGDIPGIWTDLLLAEPVALLTPFANGSVRLPTEADVSRIAANTSRAYLTHAGGAGRTRHAESAVERTLSELAVRRFDAQPPMGHVRLRAKLETSGPEAWTVETSPNARLLRVAA